MPPKQRNIRKKRALEEDEGEAAAGADGEGPAEEIEKAALEDLKLLQKMRKRTAGIHSSALAASRAGDADLDDENELMESYVKAQGGQAVFTEEEHMERYVEEEVAKRLGKQVDELQHAHSMREREELALYEVPDDLKASLKNEVSIPGLNTAITEVEVSKEARLRKIEETEAVKRRLLEQDAGWAGEYGPSDEAATKTRRAAFVPRFGRQKPKVEPPPDFDPLEFERRRRYVSERTPDPRKLKQQQGGR
ncbi:MAG: hypothetical protein J3K34DRAFT_433935 [Monoraphidium minutum]|nr:MAG: hypothetical protein J3K34DRAFT_433935 [Monoraphidium minutum]